MKTRYFALIMGIVFLVVGIAGFIPGLTVHPVTTGEGAMQPDHAMLLGLFPVNWLHNLVHIAFGIWGIAAYRSFAGARTYSKAVAVIYAVLAVMGLIPGLDTMFGLVPLYSNDIWLHALIAIAAAYFGFFAAERVEDRTTTTTTTTRRI